VIGSLSSYHNDFYSSYTATSPLFVYDCASHKPFIHGRLSM